MTDDNEAPLAAYFERCAQQGAMADLEPDEQNRVAAFLRRWDIRPSERLLDPGGGTGASPSSWPRPPARGVRSSPSSPRCCGKADG